MYWKDLLSFIGVFVLPLLAAFAGAVYLSWHGAGVEANVYNKQCRPDLPVTQYEMFWVGPGLSKCTRIQLEGHTQ